MWVSGSLIRSSTWRSSSVSAPCISSSICLPSSPERSRTMRGSFCQALPIGCIRVFMTPSCSSAVTLESRCSGTLNSVSSLRREISRSWLRVRTSSDTIVIRCSSVSTLTRIDWLAILSASSTSTSTTDLAAAGFFKAATTGAVSCAGAGGAAGASGGATSVAVSRNARSSSSSDTSPGRSSRSSVCGGGQHLLLDGNRFGGCRERLHAQLDQWIDQVLIGAFRFCFGGLKPSENFLDAIDAAQDQRDRIGGHRHSVAKFAHQGFAGMGQRFQARQPEKAASALDGVDQAKDVIENLRVIRILLEPNQLIIDRIQTFAGFRQELPQQIIHETSLHAGGARLRHAFRNLASFYAKGLILVE